MTSLSLDRVTPVTCFRAKRSALVALAATTSLIMLSPNMFFAPASADEVPDSGVSSADGSSLVQVTKSGAKQLEIIVHSVAMGKDVPLSVILPMDRSVPRPTLYLLNGANGGEGDKAWDWELKTDVVDYFADKNVNVVIPSAGAFSYYTDWEKDDPAIGRNRWSTFLGEELPPIIDEALQTNQKNAIAGISASATSVLNLAIEHPGLYESVGSYSGCASTASPLGQAYIRLTAEVRGGADTTNMWGPYSGSGWRAHDPIMNAEKLRGLVLYVSNGTGLPGKYDSTEYVRDPLALADQVVVGGGIEAATGVCTALLVDRLDKLGIPATYSFPPGTHSWSYWQDELHRSWPILSAPLT